MSAYLKLCNIYIFTLNIENMCFIHLQVRSQHATRCVDFLSRELRVCSPKEAEERIFFISAKEALLTRMREREKPVSC